MAARRGAKIVAVARSEDALKALVVEIREQVEAARDKALLEFGRIDTWINNAGISIFGEVWNVPIEAWRRMFETTYWGVVYGSLAAIEHFRERGGSASNGVRRIL